VIVDRDASPLLTVHAMEWSLADESKLFVSLENAGNIRCGMAAANFVSENVLFKLPPPGLANAEIPLQAIDMWLVMRRREAFVRCSPLFSPLDPSYYFNVYVE
jgi:hypothetical protein